MCFFSHAKLWRLPLQKSIPRFCNNLKIGYAKKSRWNPLCECADKQTVIFIRSQSFSWENCLLLFFLFGWENSRGAF